MANPGTRLKGAGVSAGIVMGKALLVGRKLPQVHEVALSAEQTVILVVNGPAAAPRMADSFATGLSSRAMTISSPASTRAISFDSVVLAS